MSTALPTSRGHPSDEELPDPAITRGGIAGSSTRAFTKQARPAPSRRGRVRIASRTLPVARCNGPATDDAGTRLPARCVRLRGYADRARPRLVNREDVSCRCADLRLVVPPCSHRSLRKLLEDCVRGSKLGMRLHEMPDVVSDLAIGRLSWLSLTHGALPSRDSGCRVAGHAS